MTHLSKEAIERQRKKVESNRIAKKIQDGGGPKAGGLPPGPLGLPIQSAQMQSGGGPPPGNFGPQSGGAPPGPKKDL